MLRTQSAHLNSHQNVKWADKFLMRTVRCIVCCKERKTNIHTYVIVMHVGPVHFPVIIFGYLAVFFLLFFFLSLHLFFLSFRIFMEKCPLSTGMINLHLDIQVLTHTLIHPNSLLLMLLQNAFEWNKSVSVCWAFIWCGDAAAELKMKYVFRHIERQIALRKSFSTKWKKRKYLKFLVCCWNAM